MSTDPQALVARADEVLAEMIAVATAEEGSDLADEWPVDLEAQVDGWQAALQPALGHKNGFPSRPSAPADAEALARRLEDGIERAVSGDYKPAIDLMTQAAAQLRASHAQEAALREERDEARQAWQDATEGWDMATTGWEASRKAIAAAEARATALERQLEEARAVIEPLARVPLPPEQYGNFDEIWGGLTASDLRRARAFFTGEPA
jgi:hypothetical protein